MICYYIINCANTEWLKTAVVLYSSWFCGLGVQAVSAVDFSVPCCTDWYHWMVFICRWIGCSGGSRISYSHIWYLEKCRRLCSHDLSSIASGSSDFYYCGLGLLERIFQEIGRERCFRGRPKTGNWPHISSAILCWSKQCRSPPSFNEMGHRRGLSMEEVSGNLWSSLIYHS